MSTTILNNTYVLAYGTCVGPREKEGPLGSEFDITFDDLYANEKSYEVAERTMARFSLDMTLRNANLRMGDIDLLVGGDLMNQNMTSNYLVRDYKVPFIGVYAACANSALAMSVAANYVESKQCNRTLAFTSSHVCTAEKQFRYPNEYGVQKPETATSTVTGAGSIVFCDQKQPIAITSTTLGRVVDWNQKDANDMGSAMMPAAYDTLKRHLHDMKRTIADYDFIVTGDLSLVGHTMMIDALTRDGHTDLERVSDCGLLIYDRENQDVFAGGSGCACSMVVTLAHLFKKLEKKEMKRILLVATGALLSPIAIQQQESIPCIAHAVCFEATV